MVGKNKRLQQQQQAEEDTTEDEEEIYISNVPSPQPRGKKISRRKTSPEPPEEDEDLLVGLDLEGIPEEEKQNIIMALKASKEDQNQQRKSQYFDSEVVDQQQGGRNVHVGGVHRSEQKDDKDVHMEPEQSEVKVDGFILAESTLADDFDDNIFSGSGKRRIKQNIQGSCSEYDPRKLSRPLGRKTGRNVQKQEMTAQSEDPLPKRENWQNKSSGNQSGRRHKPAQMVIQDDDDDDDDYNKLDLTTEPEKFLQEQPMPTFSVPESVEETQPPDSPLVKANYEMHDTEKSQRGSEEDVFISSSHEDQEDPYGGQTLESAGPQEALEEEDEATQPELRISDEGSLSPEIEVIKPAGVQKINIQTKCTGESTDDSLDKQHLSSKANTPQTKCQEPGQSSSIRKEKVQTTRSNEDEEVAGYTRRTRRSPLTGEEEVDLNWTRLGGNSCSDRPGDDSSRPSSRGTPAAVASKSSESNRSLRTPSITEFHDPDPEPSLNRTYREKNVNRRDFFAPHSVDKNTYAKVILQLFEIYNRKLQEAQARCAVHSEWGDSIKVGQHQSKTIDQKKRGQQSFCIIHSDSDEDFKTEKSVMGKKNGGGYVIKNVKDPFKWDNDAEDFDDLPPLNIEPEISARAQRANNRLNMKFDATFSKVKGIFEGDNKRQAEFDDILSASAAAKKGSDVTVATETISNQSEVLVEETQEFEDEFLSIKPVQQNMQGPENANNSNDIPATVKRSRLRRNKTPSDEVVEETQDFNQGLEKEDVSVKETVVLVARDQNTGKGAGGKRKQRNCFAFEDPPEMGNKTEVRTVGPQQNFSVIVEDTQEEELDGWKSKSRATVGESVSRRRSLGGTGGRQISDKTEQSVDENVVVEETQDIEKEEKVEKSFKDKIVNKFKGIFKPPRLASSTQVKSKNTEKDDNQNQNQNDENEGSQSPVYKKKKKMHSKPSNPVGESGEIYPSEVLQTEDTDNMAKPQSVPKHIDTDVSVTNGPFRVARGVERLISRPSSGESNTSLEGCSQGSSTILDPSGELYSTQIAHGSRRRMKDSQNIITKGEGKIKQSVFNITSDDSSEEETEKLSIAKRSRIKQPVERSAITNRGRGRGQGQRTRGRGRGQPKITSHLGRLHDNRSPDGFLVVDSDEENQKEKVGMKQKETNTNKDKHVPTEDENFYSDSELIGVIGEKNLRKRQPSNREQRVAAVGANYSGTQIFSVKDNSEMYKIFSSIHPPEGDIYSRTGENEHKFDRTVKKNDIPKSSQNNERYSEDNFEMLHNSQNETCQDKMAQDIMGSASDVGGAKGGPDDIVMFDRLALARKPLRTTATRQKRPREDEIEECLVQEPRVKQAKKQEETVACPLCNHEYPLSEIEAHAGDCEGVSEEDPQDVPLPADNHRNDAYLEEFEDHLHVCPHVAVVEHPEDLDRNLSQEAEEIVSQRRTDSPIEDGELERCYICDVFFLKGDVLDNHIKQCLLIATKQQEEVDAIGFNASFAQFQQPPEEKPTRTTRSRAQRGQNLEGGFMLGRDGQGRGRRRKIHQDGGYINIPDDVRIVRGAREYQQEGGFVREQDIEWEQPTRYSSGVSSDSELCTSSNNSSSDSGSSSCDDDSVDAIERKPLSCVLQNQGPQLPHWMKDSKSPIRKHTSQLPDWSKQKSNSPIRGFIPISQQEDSQYFQNQFAYSRERVEKQMAKRKRAPTKKRRKSRKRRKTRKKSSATRTKKCV